MKHVFWLRENVIGGRSGPDQDAWRPEELAEAGIGAVLSVNDGALVHPTHLAQVGLHHECVPLSDAAPPQRGDFEKCVAALPKALAFVAGEIRSARSVIVHCRSGKDRTGMFLCYYLCMTEGMTTREAIDEIKRVRPIALTADGWDELTRRVLDTLVGERRST